MPVVAVAVNPHHVGFGVHFVDGFLNIFGRLEVLGHFVDAIDKDERSHLAELALNCVHQHQGEARKRRHAARDVGHHHQFWFGRARILELRLSRHTAVTQ